MAETVKLEIYQNSRHEFVFRLSKSLKQMNTVRVYEIMTLRKT